MNLTNDETAIFLDTFTNHNGYIDIVFACFVANLFYRRSYAYCLAKTLLFALAIQNPFQILPIFQANLRRYKH